jgi:hypothetical protein
MVDRTLQSLICFRKNNGDLVLRGPLTGIERQAVEDRKRVLEHTLEPYGPGDRLSLVGCVGTMLSGFRSMRQQGEAAETMITVTLAVLRDFPSWAIKLTCAKAAEGGINPHWAPNDAELATVARQFVEPYRAAHDRARRLLEAVVNE